MPGRFEVNLLQMPDSWHNYQSYKLTVNYIFFTIKTLKVTTEKFK
jgi:hypothetical protein